MKSYTVTITGSAVVSATVVVDAQTPEQAIQLAREEADWAISEIELLTATADRRRSA
ncbi:MAG: hypothetical protein IT489_03170 [Gammaproteobacteria bacterium]|nr:hypothetical protein [Gammaproteobacteria bacterium]